PQLSSPFPYPTLFRSRHLVLNADDDAVVSMRSLASASCHVSTFSLQPAAQADIKAIFVEFAAHGLVMEVDAQGERLRIESPLVGDRKSTRLNSSHVKS